MLQKSVFQNCSSPWRCVCLVYPSWGWVITNIMKYALVHYAKIMSEQLNLKELLLHYWKRQVDFQIIYFLVISFKCYRGIPYYTNVLSVIFKQLRKLDSLVGMHMTTIPLSFIFFTLIRPDRPFCRFSGTVLGTDYIFMLPWQWHFSLWRCQMRRGSIT